MKCIDKKTSKNLEGREKVCKGARDTWDTCFYFCLQQSAVQKNMV